MIAFLIVVFFILNLKIRTKKLFWKIIKFPFWLILVLPIKYFYNKHKKNKKLKLVENKKLEKERLKREKIQEKIDEIKNKISNPS